MDERIYPTTKCSSKDCPVAFKDSGRWARRKACTDGWFFERNDTPWCPDHHPAWVAGWRARRSQA